MGVCIGRLSIKRDFTANLSTKQVTYRSGEDVFDDVSVEVDWAQLILEKTQAHDP